jgi:hypothetical protein
MPGNTIESGVYCVCLFFYFWCLKSEHAWCCSFFVVVCVRLMGAEADKEESKLDMKRNFLEEDYNTVREELILEEEKLRATQMTIDTNVVPRTEVMDARAKVIATKATLDDYKQVHANLIERSKKEYYVHQQIFNDLQAALKEREGLEKKHKQLQRTHTPRPQWDTIMDMCPELRRKVHERVFDSISDTHSSFSMKASPTSSTEATEATEATPKEKTAATVGATTGTVPTATATTTKEQGTATKETVTATNTRNHLGQQGNETLGKKSAFTPVTATTTTTTATTTHSPTAPTTPSSSSLRPQVHDSTKLLTLDLVELIETNRTNNVEIMELEGT